MLQREKENFGCCAAAACMQGPLLACLLAKREACLGALGAERRLKPLLTGAWSSSRAEVSDSIALEVTVTLELKFSHFCLHFPAKEKVDFSGDKTWCLAQKV